jgi:DNA-binding Lrp family transcriptional regulator
MTRMDRVNAALLDLLQQNGRMNFADLARGVKRGESTVRERIAGLETRGIIKGYRAIVDRNKLGFRIHALIRAEAPLNSMAKIAERLSTIPHVVRAHLTTDPRPVVLEVVATDLDDFGRLMEHKLAPAGLANMDVSMVIQGLLEDRAVPVPVLVDGGGNGDGPVRDGGGS